MIIKYYKNKKETEYNVEVVSRTTDGFQFKSSDFPSPALGVKFTLENGTELNITEQGLKIENSKAIYYFLAISY